MAALLNEALDPVPGREIRAVQALESLRRPLRGGVLLAVSHEGGTQATNQAIRAASEAGDGTVRATKYKPGKFLDARHPDCALLNESNTIHLGDVVVKQIAGLIARRIVCEARPDDTLLRGQKFGMIKFGSRTELYIPKNQVDEIRVKIKDKVKGGETVIARIR